MEHLQHFLFNDDPFRSELSLQSVFENGPQENALRRIERAVRQARGLNVLIGETGSGKTTVVRRLFDSLEEEMFEASMMVVLHGAADADGMLRRYAAQLGVEEPASEREGLVAQIYENLAIIREDGRHAVLIIDDAAALAGPRALAEICSLPKLEYEDRRLLTLVLSGCPALGEALAVNPALADRIDVKVSLAPFTSDATSAYLEYRIRRAGGDPGVLEPAAVAALPQLGGGCPGRVNTLADNALFEAYLCGRQKMSRADVERAFRDLGWGSPRPNAAPPEVVPEVFHAPNPMDELDTEIETAFAQHHSAAGPLAPELGPPKTDDDDSEPIRAELLED